MKVVNKRNSVKLIVGLASGVVLNNWNKPVINTIILSAHAQTSSASVQLNQISDVIIDGFQGDGDPRVRFDNAGGMSNFGVTNFYIDVINGVNINDSTQFSLVNSPTDGLNIGELRIQNFSPDNIGINREHLIWSIKTDRFSTGAFDQFPNGIFTITILAENSDGSRSSVDFDINFINT